MPSVLYRICPPVSRQASRGHRHRGARAGLALAVVGLALAAPAARAVPIEPPGDRAAASPVAATLPGGSLPDIQSLLPPHGDTALRVGPAGAGPRGDAAAGAGWVTGEDGHYLESGGGEPAFALTAPALADAARPGASGSTWAALRDAVLEAPLGEDLLRAAALALTPAVDRAGQVHVSIFGHGDLTLPRLEPAGAWNANARGVDAPPRSLAAAPRVQSPPPLRLGATERPEGAVTLREFLSLVLGKVTAFVTHPVTVLAAVLGGAGYVLARLAVERRQLRAKRRAVRRGSHPHRPHRSSRTRRGIAPARPRPT